MTIIRGPRGSAAAGARRLAWTRMAAPGGSIGVQNRINIGSGAGAQLARSHLHAPPILGENGLWSLDCGCTLL